MLADHREEGPVVHDSAARVISHDADGGALAAIADEALQGGGAAVLPWLGGALGMQGQWRSGRNTVELRW